MMVGPNSKMKTSAVRIADAGPRRLVAEHVERPNFVGQAGQQVIEHLRISFRACRKAGLMASTSGPMRLPSEPLIITTSPASQAVEQRVLQPVRCFGISTAAMRRASFPINAPSVARRRIGHRPWPRPPPRQARHGALAPARRAPACRPERRCGGRPCRARHGREAPARRAPKPDWHCSFHRSAVNSPFGDVEPQAHAAALGRLRAAPAPVRRAPDRRRQASRRASTARLFSAMMLARNAELVDDRFAENVAP